MCGRTDSDSIAIFTKTRAVVVRERGAGAVSAPRIKLAVKQRYGSKLMIMAGRRVNENKTNQNICWDNRRNENVW